MRLKTIVNLNVSVKNVLVNGYDDYALFLRSLSAKKLKAFYINQHRR